ncbi:MAG: hypothetical protein COA74_03035 [Gammaproteobacteria bacterium]|nr:MAG: hypothetical protein COA74_03035 [Gammaproteobacteria bacterium]
MGLFSSKKKPESQLNAVVLELSAEVLDHNLNCLIEGSESQGGIERFTYALKVRNEAFKDSFSFNSDKTPDKATLQSLFSFMPTVRRRIAPYLDEITKYKVLVTAIGKLLEGAEDTTTTDQRIKDFCKVFPEDKKHRWVRDLATEILHGASPELYPLMLRWVWDISSQTGVLRELWYVQDEGSFINIDIDNSYQSYITLRMELSQYLTKKGIFRDVLEYVDLLQAQIYANYICEHGGTYIRADFSNPEDPMMHIRRLLGLDGISRKGKSRLKTIEGQYVVFDNQNVLN